MRQKFEVFCSADKDLKWYVQTHCDCGSTLSSGEWFADVVEAMTECSSNMTDHLAACTNGRCGIATHQPEAVKL